MNTRKILGGLIILLKYKKDKQKIDALNKQLVENFKTTESEKIWMAVPEITDGKKLEDLG